MAFLNPYADRLTEFPTFVFDEPDLARFYRPEGNGWSEYFRTRMNCTPERLIFEVGCSNAVFLSTVAKQHPSLAFVGMDWKYKIIYKGAKKVDQDKLANVALLRGRAQELPAIFGPSELSELWLFFPDPWAKKSQLKHRLFQETFLLDAHRALKPGGRLFFKTDHPGYFQWALALLGEPEPALPEYDSSDPGERSRRARQVKVRKLEDENLPAASEAVRRAFSLDFYSTDYWAAATVRPRTLFSETHTLFEKLFIEQELPIYYIELTKRF